MKPDEPSPEQVDLDDDYEYLDEDAERDDTAVAAVFKWSLAVLAAVALVVVIAFLVLSRESEPEVVEQAELVLPKIQDRAVEPPTLPFTDITKEAGIDWVHANGARGEKMLPETLGSGAAFLDVDLDGDQDLILVNGRSWPEDGIPGPQPAQALYLNDGGGRFRDATAEWGLDVSFYGMGIAVADLEGDGDPDLFFTAVGEDHLFENTGGRFVEITERAGVAGPPGDWSTGAAFFDADADGDLDLFVCTYVAWSRQIDLEVDFRLVGLGRAYGPPKNFGGTQPRFYRNRGDGTFDLATAEAGLEVFNPATGVAAGKGLAVLPLDVDDDGDLDLVVANDTVRNFYFENDGGGRFTELAVERGLAYNPDGASTGAMGIDGAWYRDDMALAIGIGNFANEMTSLYVAERGQDGLYFSDEAITEGIGPVSRQMLSFGLLFADFDLDGWIDLMQTNGHLEEEINVVQPSQQYRQPSQLFWNGGGEGAPFIPMRDEAVGDLAKAVVGRAATLADIDGDGDPDLLITQSGDRPVLLRNDQAEGNHWLRLDLRAAASAGIPADAIGAVVEVGAGGRTQRLQLMPSRSYLSATERILTVGLGAAAAADEIRVRWPGRTEFQVYPGPWQADRLHRIAPLG